MGAFDSAGGVIYRSVGCGVGSANGITFRLDDRSGMSYSDVF